MNKLVYKLITGSLMAFMFTFGLAYAQPSDDSTDVSGPDVIVEENSGASSYSNEDIIVKIREKINELKTFHESLKEQIVLGEITKEEAIASWKEAIERLREEKKLLFDQRMERIRERFSKIREKNPELADKLQAKFDEAQSHRAEISQKRKEIANMLRSGEITKEEAQERRKEDLDSFRNKILEMKRGHGKLVDGEDDDNDADLDNDEDTDLD